ncbi:hypothetical protein LMG7141_03284 [Ralstonia condita]|uniref:Uncharacterized protein n=1 Tax=Ralstonia condita TaxID=3058600 RepID=A0ABM9JKQ6_9RALS|nr:hypothetical protein [Ralstonia sp. LMG 7141]MDE2202210.1 hypothetical protein [Burkholderiaceae bacterium]CAJ0796761.1 hypothetical protein LMG7141_03284 [Ralstonia sp. LMG 7141]
MRSDRITAGRAACLLACSLAAWPAAVAMASDDVPIADSPQAANTEAVRPPVAASVSVPGFGHAVGADRLDGYRGGTQDLYQTVNDARLSGTVSDNAAVNVATGSNIVRDGSFTNAAGIPTVIQNSGANVLIQNATIVNVQFRP